MPHASYDRIIKTTIKRLEGFAGEHVWVRSHMSRLEITEEKLRNDWRQCTLFIDGTHIPCRFESNNTDWKKTDFYSHKLKESAVSIQVR